MVSFHWKRKPISFRRYFGQSYIHLVDIQLAGIYFYAHNAKIIITNERDKKTRSKQEVKQLFPLRLHIIHLVSWLASFRMHALQCDRWHLIVLLVFYLHIAERNTPACFVWISVFGGWIFNWFDDCRRSCGTNYMNLYSPKKKGFCRFYL